MSNIEPITMCHFDPDKFEVRTELVYPDSVLNEMARRVGDKLDEEVLARLGYVKPVRCRDCEHFTVDNSDHDCRSDWWCRRWDTDMVKSDGYCAWGVRRGWPNELHL